MELPDLGEQAFGVRLASRDAAALQEAYERYAPVVLAYVTRFVGRDEAEDVLQRTFLDVWRAAPGYDPRRRFTSWLLTIAHHRAIDTLRARRHVVVDLAAFHDLAGEDGRETANRSVEAADVRRAVGRLPEHERTVLEMAYFNDLTQPEIAARLAVPLGTIKARASRGTRRLGRILTADEEAIR